LACLCYLLFLSFDLEDLLLLPDDFELLLLLRFTEEPLLLLLEDEDLTPLEDRLFPEDDRLRTFDLPELVPSIAALPKERTTFRPILPKIFPADELLDVL